MRLPFWMCAMMMMQVAVGHDWALADRHARPQTAGDRT
jgi:hypothetical protein